MMLKEVSTKELIICLILFVVPPCLDFFDIHGVQIISAFLFIITFLYYLQFQRFKQILLSIPLYLWGILSVYHLLNAFYNKVPEVTLLNIAYNFKIYACIAVFSFWGSINLKETTLIFLYSFLARCAVGIVLTIAFDGFRGGRMDGFGGTSPLVGQAAAITGVFIVYLNAFGKIRFTKNVLYYILPLLVVFLTQSRNSLLMILISILTTIFLYANQSRTISFTRSSFSMILVLFSAYIIIPYFQDSDFAERAEYAVERGIASSDYLYYSTGTIFDAIVGDRLIYYVLGFKLFLLNPLTGIGMRNYMYVTQGVFPLHSEYMIHLCEGGLIGIALWLSFVLFVINAILKYINNIKVKIAAISSITVLLFCGIYAREFYYEWFYPVYGLALAPYYYHKFNFLKRHLA